VIEIERRTFRNGLRVAVVPIAGLRSVSALLAMEATYAQKLAGSFDRFVETGDRTTLAAFGGGGPMSACAAARIAGVRQVLVPRLAAVFSAYGISFSDIAQSYESDVTGLDADAVEAARQAMRTDAARNMFQEGHDLDDCELEWTNLREDGREILALKATLVLPHPSIDAGRPAEPSAAVAAGTRQVRSGAARIDPVSVYLLDEQVPGASATGPAIVEGPFFTARVPDGWQLVVSTAGDLLLTDLVAAAE